MVCSVCGYSTGSGNDYELPKIPLTHTHIPSQTPVIENEVSVTCTTGGSYDSVVRCVTCNIELSRETVETDPLGHDYVGVVTEPGCTTEGYITYTCSRCNDSYNGDYTSPLGHTPLVRQAAHTMLLYTVANVLLKSAEIQLKQIRSDTVLQRQYAKTRFLQPARQAAHMKT